MCIKKSWAYTSKTSYTLLKHTLSLPGPTYWFTAPAHVCTLTLITRWSSKYTNMCISEPQRGCYIYSSLKGRNVHIDVLSHILPKLSQPPSLQLIIWATRLSVTMHSHLTARTQSHFAGFVTQGGESALDCVQYVTFMLFSLTIITKLLDKAVIWNGYIWPSQLNKDRTHFAGCYLL